MHPRGGQLPGQSWEHARAAGALQGCCRERDQVLQVDSVSPRACGTCRHHLTCCWMSQGDLLVRHACVLLLLFFVVALPVFLNSGHPLCTELYTGCGCAFILVSFDEATHFFATGNYNEYYLRLLTRCGNCYA